MPLQIAFEAADADRGALCVRGLPAVWPEVLVAVQRRADDRYLTIHGRWDATASWYPCPRLDSADAAPRFALGAPLTAGIAAAAGTGLLVHLRRGGFTDLGPLALPGLAPQAAAPASSPSEAPPTGPMLTAPPQPPDPAPTRHAGAGRPPERPSSAFPRPAAAPPSDPRPARVGTADPGRSAAGTAPAPARRHRLLHLGAAALPVLGGGILLWWYLSTGQVDPAPRPPTVAATRGGPTGKALFLELQGQDLTPRDLFGHAEGRAQAGDCEAAIGLFVDAAKRDPALAQDLAKRFDPDGFQPSPCFAAPNPDRAQVWYERAAQAGIPLAQRRYAELLLDEAAGGPVYQDAITWLRKAAAAGDAAAARRLMDLQQP